MTRLPAVALRTLLVYALVAVVWVLAGRAMPGFGAFGHFRYLMELAAVVGLVGAGQTVAVIGGGIDLSVGAVITVSAVLPPLFGGMDATGLAPLALTLLTVLAIGTANGAGIAAGIPPLIMTLATATMLQGLLGLVAGGSAVTADSPLLDWVGEARPAGVPVGILVWLAVAAGIVGWLQFTRGGVLVHALGTNPLAARLAGVRVTRVTLTVYAVSGFCAGLAGLLLLGMNKQGYVGIGDPYLLSSIAAVVLGGTPIIGGRGTYLGTVAGAMLLVTLTAVITVVNVSAGWRQVMLGGLILLLLPLSGREARP